MSRARSPQSFQDQIKDLFQWGSRYQAERIGVLAGFVILTVGTGVWAFSGSDDTNELGANISLRTGVVGVELVVENTGRRAWEDVRIVLDRRYIYTADRVDGRSYVRLSNDDLRYAYFIPRPWGRERWEQLGNDEHRAGVHPEESYVPQFVQIRSRQGRLDISEIDRE